MYLTRIMKSFYLFIFFDLGSSAASKVLTFLRYGYKLTSIFLEQKEGIDKHKTESLHRLAHH